MSFLPSTVPATPGPAIDTLTLNGGTPVAWTVPGEIAAFIIQANSVDTTMKIGDASAGWVIGAGTTLEVDGRGFAGKVLNFTGTALATVSILYVTGWN